MRITLDAFSGRPNPSWAIDDSKAEELLSNLDRRLISDSMRPEVVLGYRGFVIEADRDDSEPLQVPPAFRYASRPAANESDRSRSRTAEATERLLRIVDAEHASQFIPWVQAQIWASARQRQVELGTSSLPLIPASCQLSCSAYNPSFWNRGIVQARNNCYNYAINHRTDTFALPGRITRYSLAAIDCAGVTAAAGSDGCRTNCVSGDGLAALVISPGGPAVADFHWYRQHADGSWGHKIGRLAATNVDNSGQIIDGSHLDPSTCDRGPYAYVCGFFFVPRGMRIR